MYLCSEVLLWLVAEDVDGSNVQVEKDVLEGGAVARLGCPALLHQKFEAIWAGGGDGKLEGVAAHAPDDRRAVHILVGDLFHEYYIKVIEIWNFILVVQSTDRRKPRIKKNQEL